MIGYYVLLVGSVYLFVRGIWRFRDKRDPNEDYAWHYVRKISPLVGLVGIVVALTYILE